MKTENYRFTNREISKPNLSVRFGSVGGHLKRDEGSDEEYSELDISETLSPEVNLEEDIWKNSIMKRIPQLTMNIFVESIEEEKYRCVSTELIENVQTSFLPKYYRVIVRWLFDLSSRVKTTSDAIYNSIELFQRVICKQNIAKNELQLYMMVCFWISSKLDLRRHYVSFKDINELAATNYTIEQFTEKEFDIMRLLTFRISFPTTKFFMRIFLKMADADTALNEITNLLLTEFSTRYELIDFAPSHVSFTILMYSSALLNKSGDWPEIKANSIRFDHSKTVQIMHILHESAPSFIESQSKKYVSEEAQEIFKKINFNQDFDSIFE